MSDYQEFKESLTESGDYSKQRKQELHNLYMTMMNSIQKFALNSNDYDSNMYKSEIFYPKVKKMIDAYYNKGKG